MWLGGMPTSKLSLQNEYGRSLLKSKHRIDYKTTTPIALITD